ncbi:MAG: translation initiation factor IF-3 [Deltaproteobacteria bacterium]|nr:translation initiation factor IF-3 [Deltaproteobacteria bacterium]
MGKRVNVNQHIKAEVVRLIDQDGKQAGIVPTSEALAAAEEVGLDLVEVAPNSDPPVCRIMDYGKYKYQQSKKLQESKKKATIILVKEVKIRPKTEEHDYQFKLRNIRKFLGQKNKTKISLMFRGREIAYANLAQGLLERIAQDVADIGVVEQMPKMEGRNMTMMLAPK